MPRAKTARGKEPGRCPRPRQGGSPPETPRPLSLLSDVPERSSPSRVRYGKSFQNQKRFSSAAHKPRALDCCGPFRKPTVIRERGQMQSQNHLHFGRCTPPVGRPRAIETQRKDKTRKETRRRIASLLLQAHSSMRKCCRTAFGRVRVPTRADALQQQRNHPRVSRNAFISPARPQSEPKSENYKGI